ncbi:MAG TPA: cytochrome c oxidase subunit 3 family protein [Hyphomicrobium sp.]|nr:cytochrome c oxidase subunit 3 family protein [Hyphomicrobium sp.]
MSTTVKAQSSQSESDILSELPGELMMWVLIVSELFVFGAFLIVFLAVRVANPEQFAADQALLNQTAAAINTIALVTSGFCAAMGLRTREAGDRRRARLWLAGAGSLGILFLVVKGFEYWSKAELGIGIDTSPFFTFYFLITGFHALHVVAGIAILALVAWLDAVRNMEAAVSFWHLVDLVWVLLFPIIYILG